ncbi:MAG TPA: hypothetical protein VFO06_11210 [Gemmatimonadales bacterium]|nr:hypothetical protein [Gemmatimonadales bacterium]
MNTVSPARPKSRHPVLIAAAAIALLAPLSVAHAQGATPAAGALPPELVAVRNGLEKYQDPVVAVHDGYLSTLVCVEFPQGMSEGTMKYVAGGMGVHFLNLNNVGPTLDPTKPQVLIYEPVGDKLKLVAAEWFMPAAIAGATPPSIFGKQLEGPMEGHEPIMPPEFHHYDLHVWLWKPNPAGVFSSTNPAVKCPASGYSHAGAAPKMVGHEHK